jgi:hypothetical protein
MCFLIFIGLVLYMTIAGSGRGGVGKTICGALFGFMLLPTFASCSKMLEHDQKSDGIGWFFLVCLLLTIGFGAAAFGKE